MSGPGSILTVFHQSSLCYRSNLEETARGAGGQNDAQEHGSCSSDEATQGRNRDAHSAGSFSSSCLSFLNLVGLILTVTALGGVAPWSRWQFVGAFGVLEAASGLANVISPNIWRLPIAELQTSERTDVKLAASALLLPHWGGLARCAAGLVCLALSAWQEGVGPATAALLPFLLAIAWIVLAASALLARAGVARPDLDVVQLVVRWGKRDRELAPISLGASVLQFLLSIATIPVVKLLPPSVLFQPGSSARRWTPCWRRSRCRSCSWCSSRWSGPAASSAQPRASSSARRKRTPESRRRRGRLSGRRSRGPLGRGGGVLLDAIARSDGAARRSWRSCSARR